MKLTTRLVNFERCPNDPYRPVATPIYQTATFEQQSADSFGEYDYSRSGNPTRSVLEKQVADLENGHRAFCLASGMAAISLLARLLRPGEELLAGDDLYGGAYRAFSKVFCRSGIEVRYSDAANVEEFARQIGPRTRLVHIETPTNPLLRVVDLVALAEIAHSRGALLSVDNSLMSPYLQNPLDLGADIVVHSATKFLCGHSDVTAGAIVVRDPALAEELAFLQNAEGAALGPFDSFLLLRGIKTLGLRVQCQQSNAGKVAEFLCGHPAVRKVYYPGLDGHPGRALHERQARGYGSVIGFETGSFELSRRLAEAARIFAITVSFGGINSSISLPGCMSHASIPAEVRANRSLPDDLVRVSVGIEDADDLIGDLEQALEVATDRSRLAVAAE
ncbi:MAG TPA: cystathionine beta-lyase [Candidatus Saccharimonadales bacterium]|jgi:cystathionine beta-lyase|nr:cystathionine beta-lyase [Candidatus Saccharimonadales bacterium]